MTVSKSFTKKEQELYDLWVKLGKDPDDPDFKRALQPQPPKQIEEAHAKKVREAEAVLLHLHNFDTLTQVSCQNCGELFATNYWYQKHCSDECLRRTLEGMGLKWYPEKTAEERWKAQPPSVVTPETLEILKKWAAQIRAWGEPRHNQTGKAASITRDAEMDPYEFLEKLKRS